MDKLKDILKAVKVGSGVAKIFIPGGAGRILDVVNQSIADPDDPQCETALKALGKRMDELEQALLVIHERTKHLK